MVTTRRTYTLADLWDLPDDDRVYDIFGGDLVVRNVPDIAHGSLLTELFGFLYAAQQAGYGRVFTSTTAVALDFPTRGQAAVDVSHPDLVFVRHERENIIGVHVIEGVPDLVIEILSPSTRSEHLPHGERRDAYERNGVPSYWLADSRTRTVAWHELQGTPYVGGRYGQPAILRAGDTLTSPLFPTLSVPVATLFQHVPRT